MPYKKIIFFFISLILICHITQSMNLKPEINNVALVLKGYLSLCNGKQKTNFTKQFVTKIEKYFNDFGLEFLQNENLEQELHVTEQHLITNITQSQQQKNISDDSLKKLATLTAIYMNKLRNENDYETIVNTFIHNTGQSLPAPLTITHQTQQQIYPIYNQPIPDDFNHPPFGSEEPIKQLDQNSPQEEKIRPRIMPIIQLRHPPFYSENKNNPTISPTELTSKKTKQSTATKKRKRDEKNSNRSNKKRKITKKQKSTSELINEEGKEENIYQPQRRNKYHILPQFLTETNKIHFRCPYSQDLENPCNKTLSRGIQMCEHIRQEHDDSFDLETFNLAQLYKSFEAPKKKTNKKKLIK